MRDTADRLPLVLLREAADRAGEAAVIMADVAAGSSQADVVEAAATFEQAHEDAVALLQQFVALRDTILALSSALIGTGRSAPPVLPPSSREARIRHSLPRGVAGAQTQGRWLGPGTDVTVLRSGKGDQWYDKALVFIEAMAGRRSPVATLATHVEIKLAVRMRLEHRVAETVIIDREVCGRRPFDQELKATSDKLLKHFLPPGASLTVVEHDGARVVYRGEK